MINAAKMALRITTNAYDDELNLLIDAAKQDMGIAGVVLPSELDSICKQAIIAYCKMNFGNPEDAGRLKEMYDEQKAQLSTATHYTVW